MRRQFSILLAVSSQLWLSGYAQSAEIRLGSSANMAPAIKDLQPSLQQSSGHTIVAEFAEGTIARDKVLGGAPFDVTINSREAIEAIDTKGLLANGPINIARASISVAVRTGTKRPDISSLEAIRAMLTSKQRISYSPSGISGAALNAGLNKMGLSQSFKESASGFPSGQEAVRQLVDGMVDIAIVQTATAFGVDGIQIVGRLPAEMVGDILVSAGVSRTSQEKDAAEQFLKLLRSPEGLKAIEKAGLESPQ